MKVLTISLAVLLLTVVLRTDVVGNTNQPPSARQEEEAPAEDSPEDEQGLPFSYSCMFCHGDPEIFHEDRRHLRVSEEDLAGDIHWQKGLRCHDCHGGNPVLGNFVNHKDDPNFRSFKTPADIPAACGHCHSDIKYMRRYSPSARTDQEAEYWTSGHGRELKESGDPQVATCVSCHGHHGMRAVADPHSPVYPSHVAETCAACHSDKDVMAGRLYEGRLLRHDQLEHWKKSVHGRALLEKGDMSAPTCNDCHGNHGALPPEVGSVANACGACHGKVAKLFAETSMKHNFDEVGLPGCATCHGHHEIHHPSDEMLGMGDAGVCKDCHGNGKYGATLAGAETARDLRAGLEKLKQQIVEAEETVAEAERLGMEVRGPRFDLRQAFDALTNARSLVHSFARGPMEEALTVGLDATADVKQKADDALAEHAGRRVWLAISLAPILVVVVLLSLYIRTLPISDE